MGQRFSFRLAVSQYLSACDAGFPEPMDGAEAVSRKSLPALQGVPGLAHGPGAYAPRLIPGNPSGVMRRRAGNAYGFDRGG